MAGERRRGLARTAKLALLPMSIMTQRVTAMGKQIITGAERGEIDDRLLDKAAEQVFAVLGELKGGAMKLGQALSVAEAAVPPKFSDRYREALVRLQSQAPPMPSSSVHRMLEQQLGNRWRDRFQSFTEAPVGAASIGQVHRAVWADGRDVAVKVQYPGADEALMADLKMLQMFSSAFTRLLPGIDAKAMIGELIDRTADELDYRIESNYQRAFAKALGPNDPKFFVPRMIASSPKVMVTEWMEGTALSRIIAEGTPAQRDQAGLLLAEFALSSPARVGYLHCDPHPGNFALLPDGRLGIIDFGATIHLPDGIPAHIGTQVACALEEDYDRLVQVMRDNGFIRHHAPVDIESIRRMVHPIVSEISGGTIHVTRTLLQEHAARAMDFQNISMTNAAAARVPAEPPELLMIGRVFAGIVGILAQLDAEGPFLDLVAQWLPGYEDPGEAA